MSKPPLALGPTLAEGENAVEVLESRTEYQGFARVDVYTVRTRQFNGEWSEPYRRDLVYTGGTGHAAAALLYEPERDVVLLIEQFRMVNFANTPERGWQLEIPAGLIDAGETPETCIVREIREEAGCEVKALEKIVHMTPSPGIYTETLHLYIAQVQTPKAGVFGLASEGENVRGHIVTFDDALKMADSGFITDLKTLFVLNWLARNHTDMRHRWLNEA